MRRETKWDNYTNMKSLTIRKIFIHIVEQAVEEHDTTKCPLQTCMDLQTTRVVIQIPSYKIYLNSQREKVLNIKLIVIL